MEEKVKKLVSIYARVSTSNQENEGTIETQLSAVNELIEDKGYTVVQEYIDNGWSGDILARPSLDQLRSEVKDKIWEAVVIYDPDRLARRYSYQELVMDELREAGIEIIFVTTPAPKNQEDKILHGVKGLFAEYERAKISERFRLGKLRKAKEGNIVGAEAPYGLTYIKKSDNKQGYYKINKAEIENLRLIFGLFVKERLTIRKLIKRLKELGIKPRRSKRGVWSTSTISTILRNKTYIGEAHFNAGYAVVPENPLKNEKYKKIKKTSRKIRPEEEWIKIPVPSVAVIDKELFQKAQEQLKINSAMSQRNKKNEYLLANKIRCICGCTRAGEGPQKGKYVYYRCTDRVKSFPFPAKCKEVGVNARVADKLVWNKLEGLMSSPDLIQNQIDNWNKRKEDKVNTPNINEEGIRKQISNLKEEGDRYTKAYGAGLLSIEKLREYTDDTRAKLSALEAELDKINKNKGYEEDLDLPRTKEELKSFSEDAKITLNDLNFGEKREIVMSIVNSVVGTNKELKVSGVIPITSNNHVKNCSKHRHSRAPERWQVHTFQNTDQDRGEYRQLSFRDH